MNFVNKKNTYLLFLVVVSLLALVVVPTYAKFSSSYSTTNDVVGMALDFNVTITDVEEYERITIEPDDVVRFNIAVSNSGASDMYYGIWYRMVEPRTAGGNISIGKLAGSSTDTTGLVSANSSITATIAVINNSTNDIIVDIGVSSSTKSTGDIEYLDGKYLVSKEVTAPRDIMVGTITIDGVASDSLPTSGLYNMTYTCSKGSTLSWEPYSKSLIYKATSYVRDTCNLTFTTKTTGLKYLYEMPVGSYVAYEGVGGTVGTTEVNCKKNGSTSSTTATEATESANSCLGQNARAEESIDTSEYTYGYCYATNYKYYVQGWRIAYIDETNNKAVIISAGSPECNTRTSIAGNTTYIKTANALALKYCNTDFVDGDCTCTSTTSGMCDTASTDAWAISDNDFYNITKAISGVGKRLADGSSSLGDSGGTLESTKYCYNKNSYQECGYNNDLIDNGGYYWFAAQYTASSTYGVYWNPNNRYVNSYTYTYAYGLRPVISLSSSVFVTGGSGTMDDPYVIENT